MKKVYFSFLQFAFALSVSAQQLANTTFDATWVDCYPWESGATVSSARGTQPAGWYISNVSQSALPIVGEEVTPGADGTGKAVKLMNVAASIGSNNAPGYLTLGIPFATAETKMTSVRNADGGVFGGIPFTFHPDAVRLTYKCDRSAGEENMSVIAYLWKGTWTQTNVPSNTAVGVFSWGNATKVTMTDRIHNILGKETATGDNPTHSDNAELVASVEYYSSASVSSWKTQEFPLNYKSSATPENLNIVIASNGLFDDRGTIKSGNNVIVDDVELVYWHALSALSYQGATLNFSENATSYDLSEVAYDESKVAFSVKGQAAKASKSYNTETGVLTIRVEGEDISVNPSSFTEYKVQFKTGPDIERLIPEVTVEQTDLLVDDYVDLVLVNCNGLIAEYSVPGVITYEEGRVIALSSGTATLILTQPQTDYIAEGKFEIEFTVAKRDVEWVWNVADRYYVPNTVVENAFQVTSGDTSLFSFGTSNSRIAKVRNGNLIIGEQTGAAVITIRCRGNVKWNAGSQQYVVRVAEPGHVPFALTQDVYEEMKENISGGQGWDANGGIRLGKNTEIFSWGDKDFIMEISGIPDKLSFNYSSSSGASNRDYRIFESADGENFNEIWRDNKGSGVDYNSYWCRDLQLSHDTRFIKFHYYGNCAAYFREISVTELHKFECDTQEMYLNETVSTGSFTFTHANANQGKITVTAPRAIAVSVSEMQGGMDIYGEQPISVSYDWSGGDVDDDIIISDGVYTKRVHVVARIENPDGIDSPIEDAKEKTTGIYNLAGQRITKMQKGINIVNGRKVMKQ